MNFSEALKAARKGKMTQALLAKSVGVKQPTIAAVELGKRNSLASETVAKIERALGLPPGELAQYLPDDHRAHDLLQSEVPDMGMVLASAPEHDVPEPEPGKSFKLVGRYPPGTFVLHVCGNSVHGYGVFNGDVIAVRQTEQPEEGCLVVARVGNSYTLKAYIKGRLYSFPQYAKEPKDLEPSESCQVVGVMIEIVSGERRLTPKAKLKPAPSKPKKK